MVRIGIVNRPSGVGDPLAQEAAHGGEHRVALVGGAQERPGVGGDVGDVLLDDRSPAAR
ncbi:hypothetical protein [Pseudonocardia sp. ICBG601]|uniref:hypothetical protein n=1 Tax=Pseudonocardia sp. ICBG601 TaxID=2846759 RepID=UPI001CF670C9|nr:hypothetical protein [Pseudonocardia sp. ICBG601]